MLYKQTSKQIYICYICKTNKKKKSKKYASARHFHPNPETANSFFFFIITCVFLVH